MASTASTSLLPRPIFQSNSTHGTGHQLYPAMGRLSKMTARAYEHDGSYGGRMVDENLIILRQRIHEMKMIERNYEPPAEWMGWEKSLYASGYDEFICEAVGLLQSQLMNARPSLGLGLVALVALSVPTSTALVLFHFVEMSRGIFAGIHLN